MLFKVNRRIDYYNNIVNYYKINKKTQKKTKTAMEYTRFFRISNSFISSARLKLAKLKQMLSITFLI